MAGGARETGTGTQTLGTGEKRPGTSALRAVCELRTRASSPRSFQRYRVAVIRFPVLRRVVSPALSGVRFPALPSPAA